MKWFIQALAGRGGRLVVLFLAIATMAIACSTTSQQSNDSDGEKVIGKPPPAEEDPFFVTSEPGSAVPVAPSGRIGEEGDDDPDQADPSDEPDRADAAIEADEPDEPKAEQPDAVASRAPDDSPERSARSEGTEQPDAPQCFSCVRICPVEGDCDRAKDDVICGWGVHDDQAQASRVAKAECDAALDMARQMPVWSEIAGQCPAATCR